MSLSSDPPPAAPNSLESGWGCLCVWTKSRETWRSSHGLRLLESWLISNLFRGWFHFFSLFHFFFLKCQTRPLSWIQPRPAGAGMCVRGEHREQPAPQGIPQNISLHCHRRQGVWGEASRWRTAEEKKKGRNEKKKEGETRKQREEEERRGWCVPTGTPATQRCAFSLFV